MPNAIGSWLTGILSACAFVLALWLWRQSSGGRGLPGCGIGSGCEAVTKSRWSKWLGIPVAAPAALVYLIVVLGIIAQILSPSPVARHVTRLALLVCAPLLVAAGVWFGGLQWLAVRRFCAYCLAFHGMGLLIATTIAMPVGGRGISYATLGRGDLAVVLWAAGISFAALVLGQALVQPRTWTVKPVKAPMPVEPSDADAPLGATFPGDSRAAPAGTGASGTSIVSTSVAAPGQRTEPRITAPRSGRPRDVLPSGEDQAHPVSHPMQPGMRQGTPGNGMPSAAAKQDPITNPFTGRRIATAGGRIALTGGPWPVLGSAEARHVLIFQMCYTCGNCRHLNGLLGESMKQEPARFAVMMMPVPTDPLCNPFIRSCGPEHADACAYARLALYLWKADWTKFPEFNRFLFGDPRPNLTAAIDRVRALTGKPPPDPRAAHPEFDRLIKIGVNMHKTVGASLTPTLLMPRTYAAGHVPTAQKLESLLEKEIGKAGGRRETQASALP